MMRGGLFHEAIQGTTLKKSLTSSPGVFPRLRVGSGQTGEGAHRRMGGQPMAPARMGYPLLWPIFHCRRLSHTVTPNHEDTRRCALAVCMGRRKDGSWWMDGQSLPGIL